MNTYHNSTFLKLLGGRKILYAIILIASLALVQTAKSQELAPESPKHTLTYQGELTSAGGMVTGLHTITITLFTDPDGGQAIWSDSFVTDVTNGNFSVSLGGGRPLPRSEELAEPLWLGVQVDGSELLKPLTKLGVSLMALTVPDRSIGAEKLDLPYLSGFSVNGKHIERTGSTLLNLVGSGGIELAYDEASKSVIVKPGTERNGTGKGAGTLVDPHDWDKFGNSFTGAKLGTTGAGQDFEMIVAGRRVFLFDDAGSSTTSSPNITGGSVATSSQAGTLTSSAEVAGEA